MENLKVKIKAETVKRLLDYCRKNNENPEEFINECINYRIDSLEELEEEGRI